MSLHSLSSVIIFFSLKWDTENEEAITWNKNKRWCTCNHVLIAIHTRWNFELDAVIQWMK